MAGILFSSLADLLPSENHLSLQTFPFKRAVRRSRCKIRRVELLLRGGAVCAQVIYFTIAVAVFESYLELRQLLHLRKRTIPDALQGVVQESKFSSTRAYCLHKWNYSMVRANAGDPKTPLSAVVRRGSSHVDRSGTPSTPMLYHAL
jgi:hypothetical protein